MMRPLQTVLPLTLIELLCVCRGCSVKDVRYPFPGKRTYDVKAVTPSVNAATDVCHVRLPRWSGTSGLNFLRLDARIISFLPFWGPFQPIFLHMCCIFLRFAGIPVSLATCATMRQVPYAGRLEDILPYLAGDLCIYRNVSWFFGVLSGVFGRPAILQGPVQTRLLACITYCLHPHRLVPSKVFFKTSLTAAISPIMRLRFSISFA